MNQLNSFTNRTFTPKSSLVNNLVSFRHIWLTVSHDQLSNYNLSYISDIQLMSDSFFWMRSYHWISWTGSQKSLNDLFTISPNNSTVNNSKYRIWFTVSQDQLSDLYWPAQLYLLYWICKWLILLSWISSIDKLN